MLFLMICDGSPSWSYHDHSKNSSSTTRDRFVTAIKNIWDKLFHRN